MSQEQAQSKFELSSAPVKGSEHNVALDFFRSAAYSAIQEPVTGLAQIVDSVCHSDLAQRTQFLEAPQAAKFGSLDWHAQTIGGALGMLLPFLLVRKSLSPLLAEESASFATSKAALGLSLKEAAATGFVYDSMLKPSHGDNLLADRFLNGIGGAATFSALTLGSIGLGKVASSGLAKEMPMLSLLGKPLVNGVLSGVPGGLVGASFDAFSHGQGLSGQQAWQSVYGMSLVGGAFAVTGALGEHRNQSLPSNRGADGIEASQAVSSSFSNAKQQYVLEDAAIAEPISKTTTGEQSSTSPDASLSTPSLKLNRSSDGRLLWAEHENGRFELIKADLNHEQEKLEQLALAKLAPEGIYSAPRFKLAMQEFTRAAGDRGLTDSEQAIVLRQLQDVFHSSPEAALTIMSRAAIDAALPVRAYQDQSGFHFAFGNKEISYRQSTGVTLGLVPDRDIFNEVIRTAVPGGLEEHGLWMARRSFRDFSASEIATLVSHLPEQYQLAQPEVLRDYAQKFDALTQGWQETQPKVVRRWSRELLTRETLLNELESYRLVKSDVLKTIAGKELPADVSAKELNRSAKTLRNFVNQHGEEYGMTAGQIETSDAKLEKFFQARNQHARLRKWTDRLLQEREKDLQGFLSEFSEAHGLPPIHLRLSETPPLTQASYASGTLHLARETLLGLDRADLGGVLFHEMLHGEQQTLTLRNLADELKIGADYSGLDAAKLQTLYQRRTHAPIGIERIKEVLSVRQGQTLNDNQVLTAMQLDLAKQKTPKDPLFDQSANEYKKGESTLRELVGPNGTNKTDELFDQFAQGEKTIYATIPFQFAATNSELPLELQRLIAARQAVGGSVHIEAQLEWNTQQARDYLIETLQSRLNDINIHRERHWVQYAGKKHEWDAWLAGELAEREIASVNPTATVSPPARLYRQAIQMAIKAPQFRFAASQRRFSAQT